MYSCISYDYANTDQISICSWETSECSCFNMKSRLVVFTSTFVLQADSVSSELPGKPKDAELVSNKKLDPICETAKETHM